MICKASEAERVHQVVQRQRRASYQRFSITIENRCPQQRNSGLGARSGLGDLDISTVIGCGHARPRRRSTALVSVGDAPRLRVAELPGPRRTGQLARGAGTPVITLAVAPGKLLRHIA